MRAALFVFILALAGSLNAARVGDAAPDFTFDRTWNMAGETKLSDFRGRVVLLELWATW